MIVLGLDTSTLATASALRLGDGRTRELRDDPVAGSHPGHATRLLAMVDALLAEAQIEAERSSESPWSGPRTFTGLRVGMASARGLAQSLGAELVTVSSLHALAHVAQADPEAAGRAVLATIDARRGEVFAAPYGPGGQLLAAARALAPTEIAELLAEAGLGARRGRGAARRGRRRGALPRRARTAGAPPAPDGSPLHLLRAAAVCELGRDAAPAGYARATARLPAPPRRGAHARGRHARRRAERAAAGGR